MRRRHEGLTINCRLFGVTVGRSSKSDDLRSNKDNSRLFRASRLQWHVLAPEFPQLSIYGRPSISEIETDLMSCSRFHFTFSSYLDVHGLVFETSICYWQDQPDSRPSLLRPKAKGLHSRLATPHTAVAIAVPSTE